MISSLIFTVALGGSQIDCSLEDGKRVISYDNKPYSKLTELVAACSDIRKPGYRVEFARVANFLFKGLTYEVIDDVSAFKEEYESSIKEEAHSITDSGRLTDYGIFNVKGMHSPRIENDHMVFFVKHAQTAVPYEVSVPLTPSRKKASYRLLPFSKQA